LIIDCIDFRFYIAKFAHVYLGTFLFIQVTWLTGVGLLVLALLMTSGLSFVQERNFKAHGKNWKGN
jgi:hypothetical protein